MLQKHYPTAVILPLSDNRSNAEWSKTLDNKISEVFPNSKPLLYGSRDSFIPHYQGRYVTTELISDLAEISGTQIREKISREIIESSEFRAGVIHSVYARYSTTFPTVDVCAYNDKGEILLARKPNEELYRFVGGFVDATDVSLERAAYREFMEEVSGSHINELQYILSQKVDDWRYRKEKDGIMTTLFLGRFGHGQVKASDDIAEVVWVDAAKFSNPNFIQRNIMPEHREIMAKLIQKVYEGQLIPNLGNFFDSKDEPIDPDSAQPSDFEIKLEKY
jgi:bifunctional NMN adenylyltransferase/nudix hydrolase